MNKIKKSDLEKKIEALKGSSRTQVLKQLRSYVNKCEGISTFAELKALVSKHIESINPLEGKILVVKPKKHHKPVKKVYVKRAATTKATPRKGLLTRHTNVEQYGKVLFYQDMANGVVHKVRIPISINQTDDWGEARKYCQELISSKHHGIFVDRSIYRKQFAPKPLVKVKKVGVSTEKAIVVRKEYDPTAYVRTDKKGKKLYGKFTHTDASRAELDKKFQIIYRTGKDGIQQPVKVHRKLVSSIVTIHNYSILPKGEHRATTRIEPPKPNTIKQTGRMADRVKKERNTAHKISQLTNGQGFSKKKIKTLKSGILSRRDKIKAAFDIKQIALQAHIEKFHKKIIKKEENAKK